MIQVPLKEVGIDYPQNGETLTPGQYSFRVSAPGDAQEVRLSVDDGPWQPCRKADGHWWLDWAGETEGEHIALSRVIEADGSLIVSSPRLFRVQPRS